MIIEHCQFNTGNIFCFSGCINIHIPGKTIGNIACIEVAGIYAGIIDTVTFAELLTSAVSTRSTPVLALAVILAEVPLVMIWFVTLIGCNTFTEIVVML